MRRFKSVHQAQRFLGVQSAVYNLFNLGGHLVSAEHYRTSGQMRLEVGRRKWPDQADPLPSDSRLISVLE